MKKCQECDLPIPVCNALAMYRKSAKYYKLGRADEAGRFAAYAEEDYERYRSETRAAEDAKT